MTGATFLANVRILNVPVGYRPVALYTPAMGAYKVPASSSSPSGAVAFYAAFGGWELYCSQAVTNANVTVEWETTNTFPA